MLIQMIYYPLNYYHLLLNDDDEFNYYVYAIINTY